MFVRVSVILLISFLSAVILSSSTAQTRSSGPMETISIRVNEGTNLGLDLSPDGHTIAIDLLGQIWLVPSNGGDARAITDAVRDVAEDNDPSYSPDGKHIVFRGERNGRTGLFLLDVATGSVRQLTQLLVPESYDGDAAWSPDGSSIAFARTIPPDMKAGTRWHFVVMVLNVTSGAAHELSVSGIDKPQLRAPAWLNGGKDLAFVAVKNRGAQGGRVWKVSAAGGAASTVTDGSVDVRSPVFSADGRRIAYFADDKGGQTQLWMQQIGGAPVRLTNETDVTPTRVRWIKNDSALLYTANGRLWTVNANGGTPSERKFTAALSITRPKIELPPARFPEPGRQEPARGFMGLAISPDGKQIGMLALGKLWIFPVGGAPVAISDVPFEAASLNWSPDGGEVVWTAGVANKDDIFATDVKTGATRRLTSLPGREAFPVYSPDGRYIAFAHFPNEDDANLRIIDAKANNVSDLAQTRDLGSIGPTWTCTPQWSPASDGLLVCGGTDAEQLGKATYVPLIGQRQTITRFPGAPIFLRWTPQHRIVYCRHDRLWQAGFDRTGLTSDPQPLGSSAAMYSSTSNDGSILFFSDVGLRLRSSNGDEQKIGFPATYMPPVPQTTLVRNVRIIDGTGAPLTTAARDILIEKGRIAKIAVTGKIAPGNERVVDAGGRIVIPGLMDLHAHTYRPDLLPGYPYFGITTIRDQGSSMGPLVSYANDIAAGLLPGPRVSYGGFQFYSDWPFDEEQGRGIEPEADPNHISRSVSLLAAFGAQHIKTRTFRRWDINANMIKEAHRLGLRATGHCSHLLPLIAAGMDAKEHIGACEARGDMQMYDDMIQLFKAAGISVVPTISYLELALRLGENNDALNSDTELAPFMPERNNFGWMFDIKGDDRKMWTTWYQNSRTNTTKLWKAGINLGNGTDIWQLPIGAQWELERLVDAGLPPLQAIHAATGASAKILGADKDFGTIEVGKLADLVILDADPLTDIRNTRRIWQVFQSGAMVDRAAILKVMKPK